MVTQQFAVVKQVVRLSHPLLVVHRPVCDTTSTCGPVAAVVMGEWRCRPEADGRMEALDA